MTHIVALHSYRGGTGKTNVAANLAAELACGGARVAVVDTDIQSPGVHILFNLDLTNSLTLNDFLWGHCAIEHATYDVTEHLGNLGALPVSGRLLLLPASLKALDITRIFREGYDSNKLNTALMELCQLYELDYLILDTHPGLNTETLLAISVADICLMVLRPDYQDYRGTAVALQLARHLDVQRTLLVLNKVHPEFNFQILQNRLAEAFQAEIAAMILLSDDLLRNGSIGLTSRLKPESGFAAGIRRIADRVHEVATHLPPRQWGTAAH
ncbi:MinD/ParA family ATP-binding protein [Xanthobacter sp. TB0139]|uniref:MinD/ParA family ATP-binding protein n=1 Tax=Xanthobacter sp. TB0139 TaxID=3459178 RepID=UPI0040390229